MSRIGIVQTNPLDALNISHLFNEFSDMLLAVDVHTVIGQFLCNNLEFTCSLTDQPAHLVENLLHGTTLMTARNERNGTIGTMAVAALCNFQISIVTRSGQDPLPSSPYRARSNYFKFIRVATPLHIGRGKGVGLQIFQQLLIVELPIPPVDLRNLCFKFCQITL